MKISNKTLKYAACGVVILSQVVTFSSCKNEEDDLFNSSAAERLMQAEKDYTERFISSEGGWVMELYPTNEILDPTDDYVNMGKGYLVLNKFNNDNSVTVGMKNAESGNSYVEDNSAWQIISDNGPVLTYNTYNKVLHTFSDPAGNGDIGTGIGGDYEFVVISLEKDAQIGMLKGKKRGTYNRITRLAPGTNFEEYLNDVNDFTIKTFGETAPNYIVMDLAGYKYKIEGISSGIGNIYPYDGDAIADESYWCYLITKRDGKYYLRFRDEFIPSDETVPSVQEFVYDESKVAFVSVDDAECTIKGPEAEDVPNIFERSLMNGCTWSWNKESSMSDSFKQFHSDMCTGIEEYGSSYAMNGNVQLKMTSNNTKALLIINYTMNKKSQKIQYRYNVEFVGGKLKLTYDTYVDSNSSRMYDKIPALKTYVDSFVTEISASATSIGAFSLSDINLTIGGSDMWFNASYSK